MNTITMKPITLVLAACLAGCSVNVKDIEGEQGSHFTHIVTGPPATAFRRLTEAARGCYAHKAFKIDADYFSDVQEGRVTLAMTGASITMLTVKLSPAPNGSTLIRASTYDPLKTGTVRRDEWVKSVIPWAQGEAGYCVMDGLKTRPTPDPSRP
jgi:hypothetical protein